MKYSVPVYPCSINAEDEEKKRMEDARKKISAVLLPFQKEFHDHIPKSVISYAMKKLKLEEYAKAWLSKQGQYY